MNRFEKATIKIDWDAPGPALRCPMTGEIVLAGIDPETGDYEDGTDEPDYENIPTVLFYYLEEIEEFSYIRPELQEKIDQVRASLSEEEAEDTSDFDILSQNDLSIGRAPLVFAMTYHGIHHGPVSTTAWVGLDLMASATSRE